ncbi:MAG: chemotaxis protein CheC [Ignavibacteriales bacterium]
MAIAISDLKDNELDILREIANIGAGNAITALSKLLNKRVDMSVPRVKIMDFKDIPEILGDPEMQVAGILLGMNGDLTGNILFILRLESAHALVNILMGRQDINQGVQFDEIEVSALKETGNILAGSYLSALSTMLNLNIIPSTPELCIDMAGAILSVPAIAFGSWGESVLYIENKFSDGNQNVGGEFFLIPDVQSYEILLKALGVVS